MSSGTVTLVTAFGRGETLALALHHEGFAVKVVDLTSAFGSEFNHGFGPFPLVSSTSGPVAKEILPFIQAFKRPLAVWPKSGPLEFSGSLASFFKTESPQVRQLIANARDKQKDFSEDWLRRLFKHWTMPYWEETWDQLSGESFPFDEVLGFVPEDQSAQLLNYSRIHRAGGSIHRANVISGLKAQGGRLQSLKVGSEEIMSDRWVWCLSSEETNLIGKAVARNLFDGRIRQSEWRWVRFLGRARSGAWSNGFPELSLVVGDEYLPWVYGNFFELRWIDQDQFFLWMRLPARAIRDVAKVSNWVSEARGILEERLPLAEWEVDTTSWRVCPHSPVFAKNDRSMKIAKWKNWNWIAPETMSRLDWSARFELEARTFDLLMKWRNELRSAS